MSRPRGYNELDLPRDGSDPEPAERTTAPRSSRAQALPAPIDARALWESIAAEVLALEAFAALRSSPTWSWTEHTDLEGGTRHAHARVALEAVLVELTFTSRVTDTHAGPLEVDRVESLIGRVGGRALVEITRSAPAAPVVTLGPAELAEATRAAYAAQLQPVSAGPRRPRTRRRGSRAG